MNRELVLDTETTGLDYEDGHRIVEIGIVELENHLPTGNNFHYYLNPERESDKKAQEVHGLSKEFLSKKPKFIDIADKFINYISDSKIIIHNASFDIGFINAELRRCDMKELNEDIIIDTLLLAKKKHIGQSVSLDSLCKRYNIDLSGREIHGALKDAKLLASVYLELIGGRQSKLDFEIMNDTIIPVKRDNLFNLDEYNKKLRLERKINCELDEEDNKLHLNCIQTIKNSIWDKINN
jgi:DNA polymerase-3 subunit epsilon